jgi:hypothetical protein
MEFNKEFVKILLDDNKILENKVLLLEKIVKSKIKNLRKENEMLKTRVMFLTNLIAYNETIVNKYLHLNQVDE